MRRWDFRVFVVDWVILGDKRERRGIVGILGVIFEGTVLEPSGIMSEWLIESFIAEIEPLPSNSCFVDIDFFPLLLLLI